MKLILSRIATYSCRFQIKIDKQSIYEENNVSVNLFNEPKTDCRIFMKYKHFASFELKSVLVAIEDVSTYVYIWLYGWPVWYDVHLLHSTFFYFQINNSESICNKVKQFQKIRFTFLISFYRNGS